MTVEINQKQNKRNEETNYEQMREIQQQKYVILIEDENVPDTSIDKSKIICDSQ